MQQLELKLLTSLQKTSLQKKFLVNLHFLTLFNRRQFFEKYIVMDIICERPKAKKLKDFYD